VKAILAAWAETVLEAANTLMLLVALPAGLVVTALQAAGLIDLPM
jgi:hypothetical protein